MFFASTTVLLFLIPSFLSAAEQAERLTLHYTTTHGGLKAVVPPETIDSPRLGIALAGGGARAAASIGVLKALVREGIPVSAVAGTSMGAIVGGLFAAGYHPDEVERIFTDNDWNEIFRDTPARMFLPPEQKKTGGNYLVEFRLSDAKIMPPTGLSAGQKMADKEKVDQIETLRAGIDVSFGYQWFHFGDTYLRYRYTEDRSEPAFGTAASREKMHLGSWAFITSADTRDSNAFPHRGMLLRGSYEEAMESWGSDREFTKTSLFAQGALPLAERHTIVLDLSAGFGSGDIPYLEQFGIGGNDYLLGMPLPGYHRREFVGNNELGFLAAYRWKFQEYQLNVIKALYLGLSAGAANVWEQRDDLSWRDLRGGAGIGLSADTIVGPVKLDVAAGEDKRKIIYFSAGFDF